MKRPGVVTDLIARARRQALLLMSTVPFVLLIAGAVGIVGYLSFSNAQEAIGDLANQLMAEVGQRVDQNLSSLLDNLEQITRSNATLIVARGLSNPDLMIINFLPIYDDQHQALGVAAASTFLTAFGQFLTTLRIGHNGEALVIDKLGFTDTGSGIDALGLEFVYADESPGPTALPSEDVSRPQRLRALPATLVQQLQQALLQLDTQRATELADQVNQIDPALGGWILRQVSELDYESLLRLIEGSTDAAAAPC